MLEESSNNLLSEAISKGKEKVIIGIVGPCSSGKTTLLNSLKEYGYNGKHIAQEHSYVPDMWRKITNPDFLIFLDVSFQVSQQRRTLNWTIKHFEDQQQRLSHARKHADIIINTDHLSISEVLEQTINWLHLQASVQ